MHAEILGNRSEERVKAWVAGGARFGGHEERVGVTVIVRSAQELEHQSKSPCLGGWIKRGDVTSEIGESVQRLVGLDVECQA